MLQAKRVVQRQTQFRTEHRLQEKGQKTARSGVFWKNVNIKSGHWDEGIENIFQELQVSCRKLLIRKATKQLSFVQIKELTDWGIINVFKEAIFSKFTSCFDL